MQCHMQVLGQVLKAVKVLHEQGYAHCNIKPSNVMRRLKQHDWVLSDFANAAPLRALPLPALMHEEKVLQCLCGAPTLSSDQAQRVQILWRRCQTTLLLCPTLHQRSSRTCNTPLEAAPPPLPQQQLTCGHWEWLPLSS